MTRKCVFCSFPGENCTGEKSIFSKVLLEIRLLAAHVESELCNWSLPEISHFLVEPLDITHSFPVPDIKRAPLITKYNMKAVFPSLMVFLELLKEALVF